MKLNMIATIVAHFSVLLTSMPLNHGEQVEDIIFNFLTLQIFGQLFKRPWIAVNLQIMNVPSTKIYNEILFFRKSILAYGYLPHTLFQILWELALTKPTY